MPPETMTLDELALWFPWVKSSMSLETLTPDQGESVQVYDPDDGFGIPSRPPWWGNYLALCRGRGVSSVDYLNLTFFMIIKLKLSK